jgi:transcriptional regulator with XRE-family HTH domain
MFKNKNDGRNNICGENVRKLRISYKTKLSQRALADKMQLIGIDVDKNAIQRIEAGKRFVTDIELKALAEIFEVSVEKLLCD